MIGWFLTPEMTPVLTEGDIILRAGKLSDYSQWRHVRMRSRTFLTPFEPSWSARDLAADVYRYRLKRTRREAFAGTDYSFLIFLRDPGNGDQLVGGITLSNIRRRAAQQAQVGYWMAQEHAGRRIMSRALRRLVYFSFDQLGLNRLNAACLPDNMPSRRVLEKNGFVEEGFAEKYLQIDGAWRDHVLYGLTREQFLAQKKPETGAWLSNTDPRL